MRILGLDVGDKTIGIAISDPLGFTAQGLLNYERTDSQKKDTDKVIELLREYDCETVVVGLPLNLNGTDSVQTEKVRAFTEKLMNKMRSNGLGNVNVVLEDERFTTKIASAAMKEAGVRSDKRKKVIDKQAAVVILQGYLESRR
ncbi:MAG: Holliday junction resolvase RuvX [Clostridiales Family XIII bacterium]|jgi:putative Holliday junction resolvase|nr:Holliday junction resolvase RuvX [Clostridiales Family XIII bacterium]